jgi:hypothetical protein
MAKKKSTIRKMVDAVEGWVGMKPGGKSAKKKTATKSAKKKAAKKTSRKK